MKIRIDYSGDLVVSELDDKHKEMVSDKFKEIADEILTDELITQVAKEIIKSVLKSEINNMAQSQEFRKKINTIVYPELAKLFNL